VAQRLWRILDDYASLTGGLAVISPIDVIFSQFDVVQPDIVFIQVSRLAGLSLDSGINQAPDLAIEVLSPSTASNDRGRKLRMFQRYRVPEYWIVDPAERTIEIYALGPAEYTLLEVVLSAEQVTSVMEPGLTF